MESDVIDIVWFKRDFSVFDNIILSKSSRTNKILPLYIFEPDLWQQPDVSYRQYLFLKDSLRDFDKNLKEIGASLVIKVGDAVEVLNKLSQDNNVRRLWSHQETWNMWSYQRDLKVKLWAKSKGIEWIEPSRNGVVRGLKDRDGWARSWQIKMRERVQQPPRRLDAIWLNSDLIPDARRLKLDISQSKSTQLASRMQAMACLNSFLDHRGSNYSYEMSSPITAERACSRISAYLAFGQISIREVFQAVGRRKEDLSSRDKAFSKSLRSFSSRLSWHCHFIQKLEDQPSIETKTLHSSFENLRPLPCDQKNLTAWETGMTGYPMIDACMRYLNQTGWLNFRMRAMLVSFASYHLWLDWRLTSKHLARQFLDYEPGIHYSQIQMQSGTTGMNAIRIYNPIKQSMDQDPDGKFIRKWVPELKDIPTQFIHQPWLLENDNESYPKPIVDEKLSRDRAKERIYAQKKESKKSDETTKLIHKHASRLKRKTRKNKISKKTPTESVQLRLDL